MAGVFIARANLLRPPGSPADILEQVRHSSEYLLIEYLRAGARADTSAVRGSETPYKMLVQLVVVQYRYRCDICYMLDSTPAGMMFSSVSRKITQSEKEDSGTKVWMVRMVDN